MSPSMTKPRLRMLRAALEAGEAGLHVPDPTAAESRVLMWLSNVGYLLRTVSRYQLTVAGRECLERNAAEVL